MQKSGVNCSQAQFNRLIIAACIILISSTFASCGRAHYVRGSKIGVGSYERKVKSPSEKDDSEFAKEIENFENKAKIQPVSDVQENDPAEGTDSPIIEEDRAAARPISQSAPAVEEERRLPTLRRQMQDLTQGQSELKNRVDRMQNDVEDIKATVGEIHDAIKNIGKPAPKVTPGSDYEEPAKTVPSDDGIIIPDNEKTPKAPKKPAATVKKSKPIIKEASAPVRAPRPVRVKSRKAAPPAESDSAEEQNRIAEQRLRTGNLQEAKAAYKNIIEKYPNSSLVPKAKKMLQQL